MPAAIRIRKFRKKRPPKPTCDGAVRENREASERLAERLKNGGAEELGRLLTGKDGDDGEGGTQDEGGQG